MEVLDQDGDGGSGVGSADADGVELAADPGSRVVGEYGGIVVTADRSELSGTDATTGKPLWHVDNPAGTDAAAPAGTDAPDGTALVGAGPASGATLVDLGTGATLATDIRAAALDLLSGSYLTPGEHELTGITAHGDPWHQQVPVGSRIAAAGSGLVYLASGGVGRVFNSLTGHPAGAYQPDVSSRFAVPQEITTDGVAVFDIDGQMLLATTASR